ncbi:MAG: CpaF family protein, partial [Chloroflexi bacterium]
MTEKQIQSELAKRLLNKVLAKLYLELIPPDHPKRTEKMLKFDEFRSVERPSAAEMRHLIQEQDEANADFDSKLQSLITGELAVLVDDFSQAQIEERLDTVLKAENIVLTPEERQHQLEFLIHEIWGFGPLEPLIHEDAISEILIDRYDRIYVERHGKFEDIPHHFRDEEHLQEIIRRITAPLGKKFDRENPIVDARLPDGSRMNAVLSPVAILGSSLVIRLFSAKPPLTPADLIRFGSINEPIFEFLKACVQGRRNIVVAGSTNSGKTSVLNILMGLIAADERIITIENASELRPPETHTRIVRLESQSGDPDGSGQISVCDLVINAMRMRPDRLVVGEVRSSEVLDVFQAMNTGHDGTMMTIHANSPRDALSRLEAMATMSTIAVPLLTIRQNISSALGIITHQERLPDGSRKLMKVSEVVGMRGDSIEVQDIFEFRRTGVENG